MAANTVNILLPADPTPMGPVQAHANTVIIGIPAIYQEPGLHNVKEENFQPHFPQVYLMLDRHPLLSQQREVVAKFEFVWQLVLFYITAGEILIHNIDLARNKFVSFLGRMEFVDESIWALARFLQIFNYDLNSMIKCLFALDLVSNLRNFDPNVLSLLHPYKSLNLRWYKRPLTHFPGLILACITFEKQGPTVPLTQMIKEMFPESTISPRKHLQSGRAYFRGPVVYLTSIGFVGNNASFGMERLKNLKSAVTDALLKINGERPFTENDQVRAMPINCLLAPRGTGVVYGLDNAKAIDAVWYEQANLAQTKHIAMWTIDLHQPE